MSERPDYAALLRSIDDDGVVLFRKGWIALLERAFDDGVRYALRDMHAGARLLEARTLEGSVARATIRHAKRTREDDGHEA